MDADVREGLDRTNGDEWLDQARIPALCRYRIDVRDWSAAHGDRHRVEARVARLHMRRAMVFAVVRRGPMMLVSGKAVMVLRMIVIDVLVEVQRGDLAGGRGQDQTEHDGY